MPYVDEHTIEELLDNPYNAGENVGDLTFLLTSKLATYLDERLMDEGELRYADLTEVLAALEGAKADFIERVLLPYEATKRFQNGDVWGAHVINYVHGRL